MKALATSSALWTPPRAAYVHMPFCRRRCFYCDFPIQVVGSKPGAADAAAQAYCDLLHREVAATPANEARDAPLRSLYFGGGTPSLTPPNLLADVISTIRERYGLASGCEVTLEMDPGTFDEDRLAAFLDAGVTRVSLGVQSFDSTVLERAGRSHSLRDVDESIAMLLNAHALHGSPLNSVSIDLIGGLPEQTMDTWQASLAAAAASGAHHVSVYDLQVEARTAFGRWFSPGVHPLPPEEVAAEMYREGSRSLRHAGFEHYEVSNYARPGHRSAHNQAYWRNEAFLGIGLGATSHLSNVRLGRPRTMREYEGFVDQLEKSGFDDAQLRLGELEEGHDAMTTRMMLALRTTDGLTTAELSETYGERLATAAAAACADAAAELPAEWIRSTSHVDALRGAAGELKLSTVDRGSAETVATGEATGTATLGHLALSDPDGLLFSNEAIATVFARLDERLEAQAGAAGSDA